jgi:hypothetical protein
MPALSRSTPPAATMQKCFGRDVTSQKFRLWTYPKPNRIPAHFLLHRDMDNRNRGHLPFSRIQPAVTATNLPEPGFTTGSADATGTPRER